MADKLFQKIILALEIVRLLFLVKIEEETPLSAVSYAHQAPLSRMEWAPGQTSPFLDA
jgi:hypothetical protein